MSDLLYEAATNSLAADASSENCWTKMVEAYTLYGSDLKKELKNTETRIKEEYSLTSMPNAWRSAKSVVLIALAKGINLCDDNSKIIGKTEVQNQIKASKVSEVTPQERAHKLMYAAEAAMENLARKNLTNLKEEQGYWEIISERVMALK